MDWTMAMNTAQNTTTRIIFRECFEVTTWKNRLIAFIILNGMAMGFKSFMAKDLAIEILRGEVLDDRMDYIGNNDMLHIEASIDLRGDYIINGIDVVSMLNLIMRLRLDWNIGLIHNNDEYST